MKKLAVCIVFALVSIIAMIPIASAADPIANFSGSPKLGAAPLTVEFTDNSTGPGIISWSWDFGDTSYENITEQNPVHTFSSVGVYTVSLTVASNAPTKFDTETKIGYITVKEAPVADFTASTLLGAAPLEVTFTDSSTGTGPLTYVWDFGDGTGDAVPSPVHTFTTVGTYTVNLTVTNDVGLSTKNDIIIDVQEAPVAGFSGEPVSGFAPLEVTFTDASTGSPTLNYLWDFGDGTGDTGPSPVHTYTLAGTYNVTLTVTNDVGSNTTTLTDYITVSAVPPVADFSGEPVSGFAPLEVTFTDGSTGTAPLTYAWNFGDGATSTEQNPVHTYVTAGTFTVSLTVTNDGGINTKSLTGYITVSAVPPVADFSGEPVSGFAPLMVTFTDASTGTAPLSWAWDFGDGTGDTVQSPVHTYVNAGTFNVSLTVTNAGGMDAKTLTNYITVSAVPPVADFNGEPVSGPAPLMVTFTDASSGTPPLTWAWDFGDGATSTEQSPSHTYVNAGLYSVSLTVMNLGGSDAVTEVGYINVSAAPVSAGKIGVFRPSTHTFYLRPANFPATPTTSINWGESTDLPATGDWNMDGMTEVGVFRPSTHTFYLRPANWPATPTTSINWGVSTDLPVTGTWV